MKKLLFSLFCFLSLYLFGQETSSLESQFINPPMAAKPYVWWHWMGSNFSKSGITKDLEAMKEMGIGGATIFNLSSAVQESHAPTENNPWPEQTYRSPAYWEALKFAASEAQRLGLEIGLHNTVGYSTTGGPWIDEERSMQQLVWSDTIIMGSSSQNSIFLKAPKLLAHEGWGKVGRKLSFYKDIAVLAIPAGKSNLSVLNVLNLTQKYDLVKGLAWQVPVGEKWIIYRLGHASTGCSPHPVPDDLIGKTLEADKMSKEQSLFHWHQVIDPVQKELGEYIGKSFNHMLIDSYEAGKQTWTPTLRDEFIKRKGYDLLPWLLTMGGPLSMEKKSPVHRLLGSEELTQRFEWDFTEVVQQLFMDNGFRVAKKMLNENKFSLQWEPYSGPFNTQQGSALADLPMGEFWSSGDGGINSNIPAAARAAGKTIIGAEAFTGKPEISRYTEDPAMLQLSTNGAFASGVNRLILHHWVHQPFDDKYQPGMGMGWWGTHFGRHQTWAKSGKTYFDYLGRCQTLLQYGEGVVDFLCVENLKGNADVISVPDFLAAEILVKNGKVILPSGRSYPLLVFNNPVMLPQVVLKIRDLVAAGATVVSPKPTLSPSLENYPSCDAILQALGNELWGNSTSNAYKKGFVFPELEDAKKKLDIRPDYIIEAADSANAIKLTHRTKNGKEIYFVANMAKVPQMITVSFRVSGLQPELWQAENGSIRKAAIWSEKEGRTRVQFKLRGQQSVFVVFQNGIEKTDHLVEVKTKVKTKNWNVITDDKGQACFQSNDTVNAIAVYASGLQKEISANTVQNSVLKGAWELKFVPKLGALFQRGFPELIDFSKQADKEVMYFAGTVTYTKLVKISASEFTNGKRIVLDLGELNDLAQVKVNGIAMGTLWYPPFNVDITSSLKSGDNKIEIAVTNNWANRLIGDEKEAVDFEWSNDRGESKGRALKAYPDWFLKNEARPSTRRKAFTSWYYYRNNSPLQPAGLVGPVKLVSVGEVKL